MQPLNRVCFEIFKEKDAEKPTFDAVVYRVLDWLKRRSFVSNPGAVLDCDQTMAERSVGDGVFLESLVLSDGNKRGWGVRYSHPDSNVSELRWAGEVTLLDDGIGRIFYQCTIGVLHTGDSVSPFEVQRSNPSLNREILNEFKCVTKHGHRLTASLLGLAKNEKSVELLVGILNDAKRSHPVVYVSPSENSRLAADVPKLAMVLAGMAHVVVAENPDLAGKVAKSIQGDLACPSGGIRVYWPDFHSNQEPRHHRAFPEWQLIKAGDAFPYQLVDLIARQAVLRNAEGYAHWSDLQTWHYRQAVQSDQSIQDALEMLAMYEEENRKQQQALASATKEIARLTEILVSARQQAAKLGTLLMDSGNQDADLDLVIPDNLAVETVSYQEEEISEEEPILSETGLENTQEEDNPNELGSYSPSSAYYYAGQIYRDSCQRKGTTTGSVPESKEERPPYYKHLNGSEFYNGDWFHHSNGFGRVIKLYAKDYYSTRSDKHKVWIYDENTGRASILLDFMLGQAEIIKVAESHIPENVISLFVEYESTEAD